MRRTMNTTTIPTADTGDGGASGRWPQVASVEHELFSRVRYPTPAREFRSHRLPHPGELSSGTDTDSRHQSPPVVPLPHMDQTKYIDDVYDRVAQLTKLPDYDLKTVANHLVQAPYSTAGEDTFLYAVPEEYGGGTRIDPVDVLKHSPSDLFPESAFDGDLVGAAQQQVAIDLEKAQRGEL